MKRHTPLKIIVTREVCLISHNWRCQLCWLRAVDITRFNDFTLSKLSNLMINYRSYFRYKSSALSIKPREITRARRVTKSRKLRMFSLFLDASDCRYCHYLKCQQSLYLPTKYLSRMITTSLRKQTQKRFADLDLSEVNKIKLLLSTHEFT